MEQSKNKLNVPLDYVSEFEYNDSASECSNLNKNESTRPEIYKKPKTVKGSLVHQMRKEYYEKDYMKHQSISYRAHIMSMDIPSRHKKLVQDYLAYHIDPKAKQKSEDKSCDSVKDNQRFLWHEGDELDTWGSRLAKKYWDRLFKEYILIDLSRYEQNKFGMRWRLEKEVIAGKGQFICASDSCEKIEELRSWEVKFNYVEKEEKRTVLVKVRLCPDCSVKLNHCHARRDVTKRAIKRRLRSPIPLDDEILDRRTMANTDDLTEIRETIKRVRKESSVSITEDEDDDTASNNSSTNTNNSVSTTISRPTSLAIPSLMNNDSSANSVASSNPSSPCNSTTSLSEEDQVVNSTVVAQQPVSNLPPPSTPVVPLKKNIKKEEDFEMYIDEMLL